MSTETSFHQTSLTRNMQDVALRPKSLDEFVGQKNMCDNLSVFIGAAKKRKDAMDHVLLSSPPGLGKTTLAQIIAKELGVNFRSTSGPIINKAGDLAALLTNCEPRDVLFIDEIHRLNPAVEEVLYPAMEDFSLDLMIGEGPSARSVKIELPPFTLIGATTRAGLLTSALRDRFGIPLSLSFYEVLELKQIIVRNAKLLSLEIDEKGVEEIAKRARGTPRIAGRILRRVRDFSGMSSDVDFAPRSAPRSKSPFGLHSDSRSDSQTDSHSAPRSAPRSDSHFGTNSNIDSNIDSNVDSAPRSAPRSGTLSGSQTDSRSGARSGTLSGSQTDSRSGARSRKKGKQIVDAKLADFALERLGIDKMGLDILDRQYLLNLAEKFAGGPVGIDTLAVSLSEPRDAIEDIIEPYLIQLGFIARSPRGRILLPRGFHHLGLVPPKKLQQDIESLGLFPEKKDKPEKQNDNS